MIKIISDHIKAYDKVNPSHELGYGIISHIMFGHESSLIHLEIKKGKLLVMPERRGHEHSGIEYEHINCMGLDENDFYHFADDEKVAYIENKCNEIETILKRLSEKCQNRNTLRYRCK